jgi:uncharacterized protein YbjT (DUF2867 family)
MRTLVVGATGVVGQHIALALQRRTGQVRGLVRGGASNPKAAALVAAGVEIASGDLTRPDTVADACAGIDTVVCTATTMPTGADDGLRRVDHDGALALIDAAERAGVRRFLYTSYTGNVRVDCPLHTAKRECEVRLLDSRMAAIVLRPSYFMEVWLGPALGVDPLHGTARVYGDGQAKVSYISAANVAEIAVEAALRPAGDRVILEMGGPEPLSQLEAVKIFEQVLGTTCRVDFVPVEALQQQHQSTDPLQKTFAALLLGCTQGDVIPGAAAVAAEYGVELRSVADYAKSLLSQRAAV